MNVKFQVIKNRNPKAKSAGVPDINTLPCALAILPSTRRPRPAISTLANDPAAFAEFFARDDKGDRLNLQPYQREFLRRIAETERKERQDGAA